MLTEEQKQWLDEFQKQDLKERRRLLHRLIGTALFKEAYKRHRYMNNFETLGGQHEKTE